MDRNMDHEFEISPESALYDYFITQSEHACVGEVVALLAEGADVNYVGHFDKSALHLYLHTRHPRTDVIYALMEAGAFVDAPERCCGATPVHLYVLNADVLDLTLLEAMLVWGARSGNSPMSERFLSSMLREAVVHRPFSEQTEPLMDMLVRLGANINFKVGVDRTPLHACLTGACTDPRVIDALLARGASVRELDAYEMSPLAVLLKSARATVELVRRLVAAGSDLFTVDFCRNTLLHQHAQSPRPRQQIMRELIRLGCDPMATNVFGNTPLHVLAMQSTCRASITRPFTEAGVGVNVLNPRYGISPLHMAAGYNNTAACEKLIGQGASPSIVSNTGRTALANMIINHNGTAAAAALNTHPEASVVAASLTQAVEAGVSDASRLCVAYVVARAGARALSEAVRAEHAEFILECETEIARLREIRVGFPDMSLRDVLVSATVPDTILTSNAMRLCKESSRIYRPQLCAAVEKLRHKSQLVSSIKKEVGPCSLPSELVDLVLSKVPVADLRRSCGKQ
ncbi:ankyrin repeat protein [Bovine papular stomatitis virus]|uniref:Ankyrin repeat protein n=1 Tax=Bovine papular stomatitis virus TaxID=129727 RepID=A0A0E3T7D3_9POXV|nr:ankyrin repeat protein [Bovine papular stomatitis virus]AKC03425.1 ankyrin repeat protein [Bovine papular stomatitis virus]